MSKRFLLTIFCGVILLSISSCEKKSEKFAASAKKLSHIHQLRTGLSDLHHKIALKLIDGKKRMIKKTSEKKQLKLWRRECSYLSVENCDQFVKMWNSYLIMAHKINNQFKTIDVTLDGYLAEGHEEIVKLANDLACKKRSSGLKNTNLYQTLDKVFRTASQREEMRIIERIKASLSVAVDIEKQGSRAKTMEGYNSVLRTIRSERDRLMDLFEENEKLVLIYKNRMKELYQQLNQYYNDAISREIENMGKI